MSTQPATSLDGSNTRSVDLVGPNGTARMVTVIVGTVVGLTFLFGLGNVAALGIRLGVPTYVDSYRLAHARAARQTTT